jgi:hypothetical protein
MILSWCISFRHDLVLMHHFHEHVWNCYIMWKLSFLVYFCIVTWKVIEDEMQVYTFRIFNLGNLCHATKGLWVSMTKLTCVAFIGFKLLAYRISNIYIYPFIIFCGCHKCKSTSIVFSITLWILDQAMYKPDGAFNSLKIHMPCVKANMALDIIWFQIYL